MDVRLFRYLFENTSNAVIMSGCIWDKGVQEQLCYVYSCEMNHNPSETNWQNGDGSLSYNGSSVHLFIMGSFSFEDAVRLIHTIRKDAPDMVVIPYVAPIQRFLIMQMIQGQGIKDPDIIEFIKAPYLYMKKSQVKKFFFIYGNGKTF